MADKPQISSAKKRPRKVAFVMGKMNPGGAKTLAMQYFSHANRGEMQIHFICDSDSTAVPEDEIVQMGGEVHYVAPYQRILANMRDMRSLFVSERYDVVHAFGSTMNVFSMAVAKISGVPVRVSESLSMAHGREPKTIIKKILRPTSKLFATDYVSCGEDCGRWQFGDKAFDDGRVVVFKTAIDARANAFDADLRARTREELGFDDQLVVGFIGRFAAQKNPLFLIEIFKEVCRLDPTAVLLLVGDGPLRESMFGAIQDAGLDEHVQYLGLQENIVKYYQAMDCFVLPSLYEGLPIVGLEAQCSGLPVYFSDTITREVAFCDLCDFLPLEGPAREWAHRIVARHKKRGPRDDKSALAVEGGFDSRAEAIRLQRYYADRLKGMK